VVDSVVRNNLLFDNHASGISLYRIDGATGSTGNLVIHNTVLNASDARWCININNGSTGNTLRNNILFNEHSFRGAINIDSSSRAGFSSDYNSLMNRFSIDGGSSVIGLAAWQAEGYDLNSFLAAPADHFLNPASDFRLLPSSPAIDAGTATDAPSRDVAGDPRPVGAGYDIGAYEVQLLHCDDGNVDPGEVCGEPALPACADPCTTCLGCICALAEPVCGDSLVCGSEQCEVDGDCGGGQVCEGCSCVNPGVCSSGIELERAKLKVRSTPFSLKLAAEAVIPTPWIAVNPATGGMRVVIDSPSSAGGLDATLPGGAAWRSNGAGTTWSYRDPAGTVAGITKVVVKNLSAKENGRVRVVVKGKSGASVTLPPATDVRTTLVLGDASECAALQWNGPTGARPSCKGSATSIACR
jgi:hypothetical protein